MLKIIISLIASLMMLAGTILIYDARIITKNFFGLVIKTRHLAV